ncbi:MAG: elongation factor P [Planctomycetales bacterium 4484_123]|nr:MAG: elongation factor P [Planctomycetales bacterium 4484_123]
MSIKAIHVRRGQGVMWRDEIWVIFSVDHVVKGKGGSVMQIELKNAKTGQIIKQRFRPDETFEPAIFDRRKMEYLYSDGDSHVVMDPESFDQIHLPAELIGDRSVYLAPNIMLEVAFVEGQAVSVELPNTVELKVVETPPQVKGATATAQMKEALCEGGARVKVPPFIENGEVIKVDTRSGEYVSRA